MATRASIDMGADCLSATNQLSAQRHKLQLTYCNFETDGKTPINVTEPTSLILLR